MKDLLDSSLSSLRVGCGSRHGINFRPHLHALLNSTGIVREGLEKVRWLFLVFTVYFGGFEVYVDVRLVAEALFELLLDGRGVLVGDGEGRVAGHAQVHLYRNAVAEAARAEVVQLAEFFVRSDDGANLILVLLGQALLQELAEGAVGEPQGSEHDEHRHNECCDGVEDSPSLPQKDGTSDT